MFRSGDTIDGKYRVDGICSNSGGMGVILHVTALRNPPQYRIVLKYCRDNEEESLKRFPREVRLLASFAGNSRVAQIIDYNLDHDPPYFVMKYYPDGDVSRLAAQLRGSFESQERFFIQMIDCIQELHSRNEFHRDIKPANFLLEGGDIAVSDFGLTTEVGSDTGFTRSSAWWGTHGFVPPEFLDGGFKHADASGDIFMLGKTFYVLLTGRDPTYLDGQGLPSPIFHTIERCCCIAKATRYQTLAELKQSLAAAYDVLLQRAGGLGRVKQLLSSIKDGLETGGNYDQEQVSEFIEQLALIDKADQVRVCSELPGGFFSIIAQEPFVARLPSFLTIYEMLVEGQDYTWSYAETIASNMRRVFKSEATQLSEKARALQLAIHAASYMNRFAAMDTCRSMITGISDEALGLRVAPILCECRDTFIAEIEASECHSDPIRAALHQIRASDGR